MIILIQPDSLLLPALTPPCKPSSIYCTELVALEEILHPIEKTGKTGRDYSAVPQTPSSVRHSTDLSLGIQGLALTAEDAVLEPFLLVPLKVVLALKSLHC